MYKEYVDLKIYYTTLLSLYQRLKRMNLASPIELQTLEKVLHDMEEKIEVMESEFRGRE